MDAITIAQGLNAGRLRDHYEGLFKRATEINGTTAVVAPYDLRGLGGRVSHHLQLVLDDSDGETTAGQRRTFQLDLCVQAVHSVMMSICLESSTGEPLPYTVSSDKASSLEAKKMAKGKFVTMSGKASCFRTTLFLTVDNGEVPDRLTFLFRKLTWRKSRVYLPAIARLTVVPENEDIDDSSPRNQ